MRIYDINFFESIDTEDKAYWLGFIQADGCLIESKRTLAISLAERDKSHLIKFCDSIKLDHFSVKTFINGNKSYLPGSKYSRVVLSSKKIFTDIQKQGITPRKSFTCKFLSLSSNLMPHYIRGLFDGDGHICIYTPKSIKRTYNTPKIGIGLSGGLQICQDIKNYFNLGTITTDKSIFTLTITGWEHARIVKSLIYTNPTIYLDRKKEIFDRIN